MLKRTRTTFITSDLHFDHANICRYCNRPYAMQAPNKNPANIPLLEKMNEDILQMFDKLPDDCDIWNLGDVFFRQGKKLDPRFPSDEVIFRKYWKIVNRMKGKGRRLFLVLGNHDDIFVDEFYGALGFDKVYDTPVMMEDKWILSHEPVYVDKGSHFINLYGHTHDQLIPSDYFTYDYENYAKTLRQFKDGTAPKPVQKWPERVIDPNNNYRNCCLDANKCILHWHGDRTLLTDFKPTGW